MKRSLFTVATALCLSSASLAAAQDLDCPEPAAVFTAADAGAFDLPKLARDVGSAELDGDALGKIVGQIRSDYPEATDAEVADIMITAFCRWGFSCVASAASSCGNEQPPIASPPIVRKLRRLIPSQYRDPGPRMFSMIVLVSLSGSVEVPGSHGLIVSG